jgi:D-arabinose 5-phosphate isomerase GutQ
MAQNNDIISVLESFAANLNQVVAHESHREDSGRGIEPNLDWIHEQIQQRIASVSESIKKTAKNSEADVEEAILLFRDWMLKGTIVRVIGAGRAKLAGSIPANRMAHGGARVYIQDDIIPMPHTINGGGVIAVSASGETPSVLEVLKKIKASEEGERYIKIVGIAKKGAEPFQSYCDVFIGIEQDTELPNPLRALADTGEYVISELLDAMVVAAGKLAGFDDTKWRLGHEDIGATGPYNFKSQLK